MLLELLPLITILFFIDSISKESAPWPEGIISTTNCPDFSPRILSNNPLEALSSEAARHLNADSIIIAEITNDCLSFSIVIFYS